MHVGIQTPEWWTHMHTNLFCVMSFSKLPSRQIPALLLSNEQEIYVWNSTYILSPFKYIISNTQTVWFKFGSQEFWITLLPGSMSPSQGMMLDEWNYKDEYWLFFFLALHVLCRSQDKGLGKWLCLKSLLHSMRTRVRIPRTYVNVSGLCSFTCNFKKGRQEICWANAI